MNNNTLNANQTTHAHASFLDVTGKDMENMSMYMSHPQLTKQRNITAGYGCSSGCTYCANRRTTFSLKDPKLLAQEVSFWKGAALALFHTNLFRDKDWLQNFLHELEKYPYNREITTLGEINDLYNCVSMFERLRDNGFEEIDIGLENANERVLKNMNKGKNDLQKLDVIMKQAEKYSITVQLNILLGMPEEGHDSMKETYSLFKKYRSASNVNLLRPFPSTPLFNQLVNLGFVSDGYTLEDYLNDCEKFHDESQPFVPTKYLSVNELRRWHKKFIFKKENSVEKLKYILKRMIGANTQKKIKNVRQRFQAAKNV